MSDKLIYFSNTTRILPTGDINITLTPNQWVILTTDINPPTITIINPILAEDEKTQPVEFIVNLSENGTCNIELYGVNYTMTSSNNILFSYSKVMEIGLGTVIFYCNDTIGNLANATTNFYMYPIVSGGGSTSQAIIYEVPEIIEDPIEEITEEKKTKISQIINSGIENTKESYEIVKDKVMADWVWYLIGLIALLILILVIIFI